MYQFNNEEEALQHIPFFDAKPTVRRKSEELPVIRRKGDVRRTNMFGDSYKMNNDGQITLFKYGAGDVSYTFTYGQNGEITALCGSNGWCWTRTDAGWTVSNCFDRWNVTKDDCAAISVDENGIQASGQHPERMGLPERV